MHDSIKDFVKAILKVRYRDIENKSVVDIGSRDIDGYLRPIFVEYKVGSYLGIDIVYGPNVNLVWDVEKLDLLPFKDCFDWVVCTEVMEHVRDWKKVTHNIKSVLKPGGYIILTSRSKNFPKHDYPEDHWRYEIEDIKRIFSDFKIIKLEVEKDDSLRPDGWMMFAKKPVYFYENDLSQISLFEVD